MQQHRTIVRNCAPENLEIPRCAIAHLRFVADATPRNDGKNQCPSRPARQTHVVPTGSSRMDAMRDLPVAPPCRTQSRLPRRANHEHLSTHPAALKRGASRSSRTLAVGCDGRTPPSAFQNADERRGPDGEIVWSWHPDADAKFATALLRRAGDGGQKARRTGEITYKPLKPSRREGRMIG
jgi:hypothetical protein